MWLNSGQLNLLVSLMMRVLLRRSQQCAAMFAPSYCRCKGESSTNVPGTSQQQTGLPSPNLPVTTNVPQVKVEAAQPSYFGYLSGVVSSLWKSTDEDTAVAPVEDRKFVRVTAKRVSHSEVCNRTRGLVSKLMLADSDESIVVRTRELCRYFVEYPASRLIAIRDSRLVGTLLHLLRKSENESLKGDVRQCLSLMGYVEFPKGEGVRVLSIDGGGTRGMMGLEVLQALENCLGGPKVADVFDHIVGVSTGAIIAALLSAKQLPIRQCKQIYMEISRELFSQGRLSGVSGLLLSHSYYNTKKWTEMLKKVLGEEAQLLDSCRRAGAPKLSIVSCILNSRCLQPYIFRNYEHPAGRDSHFQGGTGYKLWEALQASAAAPGYFEEVALGCVLHQDGGVLANNPTALALHEVRMLWPNEKLQCVVSVGNGRTVSELETADFKMSTRVQDKIARIVDSACDTELVHLCMNDLLPANTYFRLNPYMSTPYSLDEIDPKKLEQMDNDAHLYIRRNQAKIELAAQTLLRQPASTQLISRGFRRFLHLHGFYSSQSL